MKNLFYVLLFISPIYLFAQEEEWVGTYDYIGESVMGWSVQQTFDGGYILGLRSEDNGSGWVMKINENGQETWRTADYNEHIKSVIQTADGEYVFLSKTRLIKLNQFGQEDWSKLYLCDGSFSYISLSNLIQSSDGGFILAGSQTLEVGDGDFAGQVGIIIKTDNEGNEQWRTTYELNNYFWFESIIETNDDGYILLGKSGGDFLLKTDGYGNEQWSSSLPDNFHGYSLQYTSDGGYIISGDISTNEADVDLPAMVKTNQNGIEEWFQMYGDEEGWGFASYQTIDEGLILAANISESIFSSADNFYIIKTDNNGNELWRNSVGDVSAEAIALSETIDGGAIITGYTYSSGNGMQPFLIKITGNPTETSTSDIELLSNKCLLRTFDILGQVTNNRSFVPLIDIYDDGSTKKRIIIE
jgi:hypothetical protein